MTELGQLLDAVSRRLQAVAEAQVRDRERAHRTRQLAVGLAVSLVLDVVLTVMVTVLATSAFSQGSTLRAAQLSSCAADNVTRADQRQLWQYIIQLSGPAKTEAQRQQAQKFQAFVSTTFAPVDCAAVYR